MAFPHDRLAKALLSAPLRPVCRELVTEYETPSESLRIDLYCVPEPTRVAALRPFGLLERVMRGGPCAFEVFQRSPSPEALSGTVRKASVLLSRRHLAMSAPKPTLWIVAGGRPRKLLSGLRFVALTGRPSGVYGGPPLLRVRLMVLSELPRTQSTLRFRLLGRGATLRDALEDLVKLGAVDPGLRLTGQRSPDAVTAATELYRTASAVVLQFRSTTKDRRFLMETQDAYEAVLAQGEARGEARGRAEALVRVLSARGVSVSDSELAAIRGCSDIAKLDSWLERAVTASSVGEVLR